MNKNFYSQINSKNLNLAINYLFNTENIYKNLKLETYTDYKLSNELKFYNQTKYRKEYYGYEDMNLSLNFNFYDSFSDNIATQDSFKIKNISGLEKCHF